MPGASSALTDPGLAAVSVRRDLPGLLFRISNLDGGASWSAPCARDQVTTTYCDERVFRVEMKRQKLRERHLWDRRSTVSNFGERRKDFRGDTVDSGNSLKLIRTQNPLPGVHPDIKLGPIATGSAGRAMEASQLRVSTMYKRKADKVQPQNVQLRDGGTPGGRVDWRKVAMAEQKSVEPDDMLDTFFEKRYAAFPRGTRLTDERFNMMRINPDLSVEERALVKEMLLRREPALAWDFSKCGRIRPEVAPPQKIRTIDHVPWQAKSFNVPKALSKEVRQIFRERIDTGRLEPSCAPYRNPWFLVSKKGKGYRLINSATNINAVTIRDANIPPTADEFADAFSGSPYVSLADLFSGYDQLELDKASRDLTSFYCPFGLYRMTTLP